MILNLKDELGDYKNMCDFFPIRTSFLGMNIHFESQKTLLPLLTYGQYKEIIAFGKIYNVRCLLERFHKIENCYSLDYISLSNTLFKEHRHTYLQGVGACYRLRDFLLLCHDKYHFDFIHIGQFMSEDKLKNAAKEIAIQLKNHLVK